MNLMQASAQKMRAARSLQAESQNPPNYMLRKVKAGCRGPCILAGRRDVLADAVTRAEEEEQRWRRERTAAGGKCKRVRTSRTGVLLRPIAQEPIDHSLRRGNGGRRARPTAACVAVNTRGNKVFFNDRLAFAICVRESLAEAGMRAGSGMSVQPSTRSPEAIDAACATPAWCRPPSAIAIASGANNPGAMKYERTRRTDCCDQHSPLAVPRNRQFRKYLSANLQVWLVCPSQTPPTSSNQIDSCAAAWGETPLSHKRCAVTELLVANELDG